MSLPSGSRLGPYEIVSPIGAGGMGEVYKARDSRLERAVAIKVLPEALSGDAELRARFEREARAIAALDHPHICAVYDVGQQDGLHYLVMQHLDGETLAARLARQGPLPLEQALPVAIAIADALDRTHRAGIIHRDLKPANIMLTKAGAKLLDFGLAKLRGQAASISMSGITGLATAAPNTARGTILGTVQYMAPEQVEGRDADARSDIWALGALMFEMVVGRRPFDGATPASVIGAILKDTPPPISAGQPLAPPALDHLVETCLAKDPDDRWQSVGDIGRELRWIASNPVARPTTVAGAGRRWRSHAGWAVATVLVAGLVAAVVGGRGGASEGELIRLSVVPPDNAVFSGGANATVPVPQFAVSPDGRQIAFAAAVSGSQPGLWLRSLNDLEARAVPQSEGAEHPFWSPDGRWVGFFANGKLKKVPAAGGPPQVVAEGIPNALGGSWGADGTILFAAGSTPIFRVSSAGGATTPVTTLDTTHQEVSHRWPQFLPDGNHFLYLTRAAELRGIYVAALDGKTRKRLVDVDSSGIYVRPGLLWLDGDTLLGQPFDAKRLELIGQSVTVAERVGHASTGFAAASVSQTGLLAYAAPILRLGRLTWFDRTGEARQTVGPEGDYADFRLSPDERRLSVSLLDPKIGGGDIWIDDLARGRSRFTYAPTLSAAPIWSPDGSRILFRTNRTGTVELYQKSAAGGGAETAVYSFRQQTTLGMQTNNLVPSDWSPDGRYVMFSTPTIASGSNDIFLLPMGGGQPTSFLASPSDQIHGAFSPDGRFVAYDSNESGRFEVYVETFPRSERKWQVSTSGGSEPRWRGDGHEIYYLSEDRKLMAVAIGPGPSFAVPKALFQTRTSGPVTAFRMNYVVNRAGDRFLINTQTDDSAHIPITVALNWATVLNK